MSFILEARSTITHLVKEVENERGTRRASTKCGVTVLDDSNTRPMEWTIWPTRVDCSDCLRSMHD